MKEEKDREFILQKKIVIPAGTKFNNFTNDAKEKGYYDTVIGIGVNCVEFLRIESMDEILKLEPDYFKENKL